MSKENPTIEDYSENAFHDIIDIFFDHSLFLLVCPWVSVMAYHPPMQNILLGGQILEIINVLLKNGSP
jgi:hypothetical protein